MQKIDENLIIGILLILIIYNVIFILRASYGPHKGNYCYRYYGIDVLATIKVGSIYWFIGWQACF